jgi:hypothetical protein
MYICCTVYLLYLGIFVVLSICCTVYLLYLCVSVVLMYICCTVYLLYCVFVVLCICCTAYLLYLCVFDVLICICCTYVYLLYCVLYICCTVVIGVFTLDAGMLASSQYPEGPATGHHDTGFSWFPRVFKQMLIWLPRPPSCYRKLLM